MNEEDIGCSKPDCPCCEAWIKHIDDLMRAISGDIVLPSQRGKRIKMTLTSEA